MEGGTWELGLIDLKDYQVSNDDAKINYPGVNR
jgi:hypothetical protein